MSSVSQVSPPLMARPPCSQRGNAAMTEGRPLRCWGSGKRGSAQGPASVFPCASWLHGAVVRRVSHGSSMFGEFRGGKWKSSPCIRGRVCNIRKITSKVTCTLPPHTQPQVGFHTQGGNSSHKRYARTHARVHVLKYTVPTTKRRISLSLEVFNVGRLGDSGS